MMFIHRDDADPEKKKIAELLVAKHRNGPTDNIPLGFEPSLTQFRNGRAARSDGRSATRARAPRRRRLGAAQPPAPSAPSPGGSRSGSDRSSRRGRSILSTSWCSRC